MSETLKVDMIACDGHGVCAELVPELIGLDEWGYPIVSATPVSPEVRKHAKRAVSLCPRLALSLTTGERPARADAVQERGPGRRRR